MARSTLPVVGVDFGTTNSSVAWVADGQVQLVQFPSLAGETASSRSLLYFQRDMEAARRPVSVWTGPAAVNHRLATDSLDPALQGRLMQSLKSYLAARDLRGTEVFGRQYAFEDLVARMLRDLRQRTSEVLGAPVTEALVGRPVTFVGAASEGDNAFAQERLRQALHLAGFEQVRFAMEPVAAAYAYQTTLQTPETVLIGDFGGGTTDFALLQLRPATTPRVLGNTGVGLAGDAFDARIVRHLISPALGAHAEVLSQGKRLPALPAWVYAHLERWHTLSFLRTRAVQQMLQAAERQTLEPEKIRALRMVVENDLGYTLHQAVQQLKLTLSTQDRARFLLHADELRLEIPVSRAEFEQ